MIVNITYVIQKKEKFHHTLAGSRYSLYAWFIRIFYIYDTSTHYNIYTKCIRMYSIDPTPL